ncbi:hypothetical protein BDV28DRAFT_151407 [Aspergillus coremiiformis]|uniref:Uncharacterized protein n=1 Tax=Aspergillus coremiiformis TaxID=138285 RepID=A0A5N6YWX5_9EURO|nr:hypothetical protein BDV28DRAFT_151407 [Aspergillus coremiiformis]
MERTGRPPHRDGDAGRNQSLANSEENERQDPEHELSPSSSTSTRTVQQKPPSRWQALSLDTWFWEVFSVVFSVLCFITIFVILLVYNQRPSPMLPHGLTLNTIVSVLATGTKSSMIFVTSAAIGQLKWIWFRKQNRLDQMQSFDNASRGPLGSITILFQHKACSLVSLGALITILALAFDPFMQQLLSYRIREITSPHDSATVKRNLHYRLALPDLNVTKALNAGIWTDNFHITPTCPSGNCTWPTFPSVEFCSKCEDITSTTQLVGCRDGIYPPNMTATAATNCIIFPKDGYNLSIPIIAQGLSQGQFLVNVPKDTIWMIDHLSRVDPNRTTHNGVEYPVFTLAQANFASTTPENLQSHLKDGLQLSKVTACSILFCVKEYNISVSAGTPSINVVSEDYGKMVPYQIGDVLHWAWGYGDRSPIQYTLPPSSNSDLPVQDALPWTNLQTSILTGNTFQTWEYTQKNGDQVNGLPWRLVNGQFSQTEHDSTENFPAILNFTLQTVVHNVAASLSEYGRGKSSSTVSGNVSVSQVYVSVTWPWLALPVIVLVLTIIFLIVTVLVNRGQDQGLWKTSILPVLYHGLDDDLLSDGDEYTTVSRMDDAARSSTVKLQASDSKRRRMLS